VTDRRTAEQHMADVAAATLARLHHLHGELGHLKTQLEALAYWADEHHPDTRHGLLLDHTAAVIGCLGCCVTEAVRDVASTLPIRGLDYGDDAA
jgi:hypothetical protein